MSETLLTNSSIKLYGRVMTDLAYEFKSEPSGFNNFLLSQLAGRLSVDCDVQSIAADGVVTLSSVANLRPGMSLTAQTAGDLPEDVVILDIDPTKQQVVVDPHPPAGGKAFKVTAAAKAVFARIYAFSFEGAIYSLPKPSIFLVHGPGRRINSNHRTNVEVSGVAAREWEFSGAGKDRDLYYWEYEKGDFSLRLDSEAGPFEAILLAAALRAGADMADRSGASLGIRSGASLAGASLSGASLSGASVSGASLSGASLSGASLRTNR